jgi:thiamine-phosphate pyrophosphorylase
MTSLGRATDMYRGNALKDALAVYLVTDERSSIDDCLRVVRQALEGGATTVQLRRKHDDGRILVQMGQAIRDMTREYHALYIVNDRVDIALITDADGVHVGQSDIAYADVRSLLGTEKVIGVSVSTIAEADEALAKGADYLGVGSVFPTRSKSDADLCGIAGLREIANLARRYGTRRTPTVAIGGITAANASEVLGAGADGLAVVSAIMQADNPADAARNFRQLFS